MAASSLSPPCPASPDLRDLADFGLPFFLLPPPIFSSPPRVSGLVAEKKTSPMYDGMSGHSLLPTLHLASPLRAANGIPTPASILPFLSRAGYPNQAGDVPLLRGQFPISVCLHTPGNPRPLPIRCQQTPLPSPPLLPGRRHRLLSLCF